MKKLMTNYILLLVLLLLGCHIFTAVALDSEINVWAGVALLPAAITYAVFGYTNKKILRKHAYGELLIHLVTYLLVNMSYFAHAMFTAEFKEDSFSLQAGWYGVIIIMPLFWGLGLLMHTFGAWMTKGFEDVSI